MTVFQLQSGNRSYIRQALVLVFALWAPVLMAQRVDVAGLLKTYPNASMVYLTRAEDAKINVVKGKLSVLMHHHEEFVLLKQNLNTVRKFKIPTSSFIAVKNLKAEIYVYNGKDHKRENISDIALRSENNNSDIFYHDEKYYLIEFLTAKEGDIISVDYDEEFNEPHFFGGFYFSEYSPVLSSTFTVTYPAKNVALNTKEFNSQKLNWQFQKDSSARAVTLKWNASLIPALTEEYLDPGYRYKASRILLSIKNYKTGDSLVQIGGNVANLYAWNRELCRNVDLRIDPAVKKLTDSLTKGVNSDREKMKEIFHWVQGKIAYLAYEDGLAGYVPREAGLVCDRRFGDCKDMANLMVQMAKAANLRAYPAWIGTNEIPHNFSDFASPSCANHMITVMIDKGDTLFLDATGKNQPFGFPTAMIQGKEALTGITPTQYCLPRVPWISEDRSVLHDSVILEIGTNRIVKGEGYYSLTGYERIYVLNFLQDKSYEDQKTALKNVLEKGSNKFTLDTFYVVQKRDDVPLLIRYSFSIRDYVINDDTHSFINLNFSGSTFDRFNLKDRVYPIHFRFRSLNKLTVNLKLPQGQMIDFIPKELNVSNSLGHINYTCRGNDKNFIFTNTIAINESIISNDQLQDFDHLVRSYKKDKSAVISLTTKK